MTSTWTSLNAYDLEDHFTRLANDEFDELDLAGDYLLAVRDTPGLVTDLTSAPYGGQLTVHPDDLVEVVTTVEFTGATRDDLWGRAHVTRLADGRICVFGCGFRGDGAEYSEHGLWAVADDADTALTVALPAGFAIEP